MAILKASIMALVLSIAIARRSARAWSSGPRAIRFSPPQGALVVESRGSRAALKSRYAVEAQHHHSSFNGLQVCTWVDSTPSGEQLSSRSGPHCFDKEEHDIVIGGLEVGSHRLSAAVVAPGDPDTGTQPRALSPLASTEFEVVLREPFAATYEWQDVRESHSLPAGLEILLPLDGVGQKRARIPPTWQLQKFIEIVLSRNDGDGLEGNSATAKTGDGFFLRTDVRRETTISELRREIASHRRVEGRGVDFVELSLGGRLLEDDETVEALNLFNCQRDFTAVVAVVDDDRDTLKPRDER